MSSAILLPEEPPGGSALMESGIVDAPPNRELDTIVQIASLVCEAPIALVAWLDETWLRFKAQVGLGSVSRLARHDSFCAHAIAGEGLLEVRDTRDDARFRDNPLVAGPPHIRFYAGVPLLSDGHCVGILCVLDDKPGSLDDKQRQLIATLAVSASRVLATWDAKRKQILSDASLESGWQGSKNLVAATNLGAWKWNIQTGALNVDERYAEIAGLEKGELASVSAETAFPAIHPDDMNGLTETIGRHLASRSERYDHEFRLQRRNGDLVWVHGHGGVVTRTPDGLPEWLFGTLEDIGERKRQEIALTETRAFLDRTGRLAGVGGWEVTLATGTIAWSAESYTIHGVTPDFTPTLKTVLALFTGQARLDLQDALARATAGEGGWDLEFPLIRPDGHKVWVRIVGSAEFENGKATRLVGATQDVTEHVAQRRALEAANERVTIATETAGIGVWEWDIAAGTMVWGNRMFGLYDKHPTDGVLAYDDWLHCLHPDDRDRADLAARTAAAGRQPYNIEFRVVWDDGSIRFIHATARTYGDQQGRVTRIMGVNWDVTEARLLESERDEREKELRIVNTQLERTARHLVRARDDADQASRAKSRFLAGMSHELRTPLNGILGYAQLLQMEGGLNVSQGTRLGSMLAAGTHLMEMINSVLELSEIESGHVELHPVEVDLSKMVLASLDLMQPQANAKGLRLSFNADLDAPRSLVTDQMRLRQIILNLLGNAVKFTDHGHVELRLRASPNRDALRIEIADTGPGIKPDQRDYLFKDFERLQANDSGKVEGAGLGLALSFRLVALLGGFIGHNDNPGGGSVFWLELPLDSPAARVAIATTLGEVPAICAARDESAEDTAVKAQGTNDGRDKAAHTRLRVLVVDDVAMNRDIACSFLRVAGHDSVCVEGGAEAVDAVLSGGFDVVLMDVRMPEVDGLEATRRIRGLKRPEGQVPIIGLTAQAFTEQVLACTQAGMDGHVSKPYTPDALRNALSLAMALPRNRVNEQQPAPYALAAARGELPVLDPEAVKRMADYLAPPIMDMYLRIIISRCTALLETLSAPGEITNPDGSLAEATHILAGSAGMLGFTRLANDGVCLEQALRARSPEVPALAGRLKKSIGATLGEARKLSFLQSA